MKSRTEVKLAISRILDSRDFSLKAADALVSAILNEFPDDKRFEDILDLIAQYRPGGGEFLFSEKDLEAHCKAILKYV